MSVALMIKIIPVHHIIAGAKNTFHRAVAAARRGCNQLLGNKPPSFIVHLSRTIIELDPTASYARCTAITGTVHSKEDLAW
jgi:hypothetical protein